MTLLELLVKELPKRGGWPEGAFTLCQSHNGTIESIQPDGDSYDTGVKLETIVENYRKFALPAAESAADMVNYLQYEAALSVQIEPEPEPEPENKVTPFDILTVINGAVQISLDDAIELVNTLMDEFDIKHK